MTRKVEWRNLIFYGFIIVYSISLIFLSFKLNISIDEAYSLHTTSNNLATVIKQAYDFEGQPPFYFLLLAIWRHVNSGIFFARLLSLVFIGFSGYFFLRLVRLVSGRESSRWMLVILFLIISLIGLYTQYFFILEISALAFSLLVFKCWKIFFKFCLYLLPLLVLFIP